MDQTQTAAGAASQARGLRRIIVATDLSARSDRAMARAQRLAEAHGAALTVLHVVDAEQPEKLRLAAEEAARECVAATLGSDVAPEIRAGAGAATIVAAAAEANADLIVLGRHRNTDGAKPLAGTTLDRVVRQSTVPVLLASVPVGQPYRRAIAGLDLSAGSVAALEAARAVAPEAELTGVHAYEVPFGGFQAGDASRAAEEDSHAAEIGRLLDACPAASGVARQMRHGNAHEVLREAVRELSADLLALGTHARTGLARAILGSVAETFLTHPPCDVLVARGVAAPGR